MAPSLGECKKSALSRTRCFSTICASLGAESAATSQYGQWRGRCGGVVAGSVQPRTRPRARGLRGSAEGRPCRSVFPSAVRNFRTFRPEAFDAVLRPQNLTGEVSAGVWRGRRPSRSDLPSRGVDGRRAYLVTSGSRAKPGTIVRGRYTFGWSIGGRRMVSCTRPLAQEHIPSSLA